MLSYHLQSKRRPIWGKYALESNAGMSQVQDCIDDHRKVALQNSALLSAAPLDLHS